jgi:GT2 family glycosyltransferase/glycosyltransferase involved in cell wall biosynthesis
MTLDIRASLDDGRSVRLFRRRLTRGRGVSPLRIAAREAIDRPGILLSPRSWRRAAAFLMRAWRPKPPPAAQPADSREAMAQTSRAVLASFLAAGSRLSFAATGEPVVSVIVIVWNRADLTLGCLRALAAQRDVAIEIVIVDNASTDETSELLERLDGVTVIRNAENVGFTVAVNIGAKAARGELLLLLNNDAELVPGAVRHLVETCARDASIGAVGGKLVFPDGRLQEAGSIIWADGSCEAYGRGGDPASPEFNFARPVDFCSAALLLTRRTMFDALGGFDERYRPAYYEDADYCARLWARGYSVIYQPNAAAIHHEFGSATSSDASVELQRERRPLFASLNREWLSTQRSRNDGVLAARSHPHGRRSLMFVDDAAPDGRLGAGFPRAAALVRTLEALGYFVTIFETAARGRSRRRDDSLRAVEIVGGSPAGLRAFLTSRRGHDLVIVSRPHNMQYVKAAAGSDLSALGVPCVYDAEAIFALREIGRRRIAGNPEPESESRASIDAELRLTRGCAGVLVVCDAERRLFAGAGTPPAFVVAHAVEAQPTSNRFECRRTMLFVGAFGPDSPNNDAVGFFCGDVLPALRRSGCDAPLVVAGARIPDALRASGDASVTWHSDVDDLTPFYDEARVFVAPTRFAAGIPLKVVEAAAYGVPVVCTPLVAQQLGWQPGAELLTAESPSEFADAVRSLFAGRDRWTRLREAALRRVAADYSSESFRSSVERALRAAVRSGE